MRGEPEPQPEAQVEASGATHHLRRTRIPPGPCSWPSSQPWGVRACSHFLSSSRKQQQLMRSPRLRARSSSLGLQGRATGYQGHDPVLFCSSVCLWWRGRAPVHRLAGRSPAAAREVHLRDAFSDGETRRPAPLSRLLPLSSYIRIRRLPRRGPLTLPQRASLSRLRRAAGCSGELHGACT